MEKKAEAKLKIDKMLSRGLDAFCRGQRRDLRRMKSAISLLRLAISRGKSRDVVGRATARLLDAAYDLTGDCALFDPVADYLEAEELVNQDFDDKYGRKFKKQPHPHIDRRTCARHGCLG